MLLTNLDDERSKEEPIPDEAKKLSRMAIVSVRTPLVEGRETRTMGPSLFRCQ